MTRGAVQGLPVTLPASAGGRALPEEFEVRGEVYIRLSDFDKVGGVAVKLQQQTCSHSVYIDSVL
jgi:NAD-dependent DNA ligase